MQLQLARRAGYELPWSHAVLRALELQQAPGGLAAQRTWIARQLGTSVDRVREALAVLEGAAQIKKTARGYKAPRCRGHRYGARSGARAP